MKAIKILTIALITILAFNAANAQIKLPPHPKGPPPPPRLHIKAPHIKWPRVKRPPAHGRVVLHRPPAPRGLPAPPAPRRLPPPPPRP